MEATTAQTTDNDFVTLPDLLRRAAAFKGLKLYEGATSAYSEPIKVYTLDHELLDVLEKSGIKRQARPDCDNKIFTLVDGNPQKKTPGWAVSNCWNFPLLEEGEKRRFDLRITLSAGLSVSSINRGIVLVTKASGTAVSAADELPNFRMFKALVENDADAPAIAKELVEKEGTIVVTWTELGLGGIRRLTDLFTEFTRGNKDLEGLARRIGVFDPHPYPHNQQPGDERYVPEPIQPQILEAWRKQVLKYCERLVGLF